MSKLHLLIGHYSKILPPLFSLTGSLLLLCTACILSLREEVLCILGWPKILIFMFPFPSSSECHILLAKTYDDVIHDGYQTLSIGHDLFIIYLTSNRANVIVSTTDS